MDVVFVARFPSNRRFFSYNYRLKDPTTRRQREHRLKSEFAFFQSFLPNYFFNRRRTLLELNSYEPYPNSERNSKFHRCLEILFTLSIIRKIRHFQDVVVQTRQRNVEKKYDAHAKLLFVQTTGDMNTYLANESGFPSSTTTEDCAFSLSSGRCSSL